MAERRVALITGIAGGLAQLVGEALHERGYEIVGIDYRPLSKVDFPGELYRANYNKTKIEDVFRRHKPTHVLHLGRVGNLKERIGKRFDLNVIGSRKVMDLAARYGARRLLVMSTFHIYGAHHANHIPIYEDEPLRAGTTFPQIADAIQLDNQAVTWIYQHREVPAVVLRPCNIVGPRIRNAMSRFLRQQSVPVIMGFDPMIQFVHERDLTAAVVAVAERDEIGVFNVAGSGTLPFRQALAVTGARQIPVPASLATAYLKTLGLFAPTLPSHLVNFFKYPCIIADEKISETFGWAPEIGQAEAIRSTVHADT